MEVEVEVGGCLVLPCHGLVLILMWVPCGFVVVPKVMVMGTSFRRRLETYGCITALMNDFAVLWYSLY